MFHFGRITVQRYITKYADK
uniref:Uncharacterized protein n=1 Tax=Arundo donax TaxID=35708 RepID=A0A0A9EDV7_ARUDO